MNKPKKITITFTPESINKTSTGYRMRHRLFTYSQLTSGLKIPTGPHSELWPGENPRDTETAGVNSGDTEKMMTVIASESIPSTFEASHSGLHYSCSSAVHNADGTLTVVLCADAKDSIFGGGHSHYRFEKAYDDGFLASTNPHYIGVEFHIGLSEKEITNIIHAQENFKTQKEESFDHLNGLFDWVKEELASNGRSDVMRFNQNQKNKTGGNFSASVTDFVVQGMHFFTKPFEEYNDHISYPTSSYSSPSLVSKQYRKNHKTIAKDWRSLLMIALEIREHVEVSIVPLFEKVLAESCVTKWGKQQVSELTKEELASFWKVIGKQKHNTKSTLNNDVYFYKVHKSIWQTALFLLRRFVVLTKDGYTTNKTVDEIKDYWDNFAGPEFAKTIFGATWSKMTGPTSKENPTQWRYERNRDMNSLLKDNDFWGKLAQREQLAYSEYQVSNLQQALNEQVGLMQVGVGNTMTLGA